VRFNPRSRDGAYPINRIENIVILQLKIEVQDALVMRNSIAQFADVIQPFIRIFSPQMFVWKSLVQMRNPERRTVGLSRESTPEAKSQFSNNSSGSHLFITGAKLFFGSLEGRLLIA